MTLRTRFLITALFLCHQLLAGALVTTQLLAEDSGQAAASSPQEQSPAINTLCANQAASQDSDSTTICALQQEKAGNVYKLHADVEIHYRASILRADEVRYNSGSR